jgi:cytoskeletal protein CcmA (bactofilin family)
MTGRVVGAAMVAALVLLTPGTAAAAGPAPRDARVAISGPVSVGTKERVDGAVVSVDGFVRIAGLVDGDVIAVHGDVTVARTGRVTGTVTVFDGTARILGHVGDHVTVLHGRAIVESSAVVRGDVRASEHPRVAPGAVVSGTVEKTNFSAWFTAAGWALLFLWWLAVTVTLFVVGILFVLLLPGGARAVSEVGRRDIGQSVLWGVLLGLALPIVAGLLAATLVALPLAFGTALALALAFPLGYVVSALVLGRLIVRTAHLALAFIVGFAILRAVALVPGLGWIVGFLAAGYGVGALAVAGWRAAHGPTPGPDAATGVPNEPAAVEAAG